MPTIAALTERIRRLSSTHGVIIVRDPFALLDLQDVSDGTEVLVYKTPLAFRRRFEPLRYAGAKVIVHVQSVDAFIPDIEARIQSPEQIISVTPHSVLVVATKDQSWPESVNSFGKLVVDYLSGIVGYHRRFRERVKVGFSDSDAQRVILSGVIGIDLGGDKAGAEAWELFFRRENTLKDLERRAPALVEELHLCMKAMGEPVSHLADGNAEAASRALWTARILSQHMQGALAFLPSLSPDFFFAQNWNEKAVTALADAIEALDAGLAAEQVADAEKALTPNAVEAVAKKLGLSDTAKDIRTALRERVSPLVLDLSLRHVLAELPMKPKLLSNSGLQQLIGYARKTTVGADNPYAALLAVQPDLHTLLQLLVDLFDLMTTLRDQTPTVKALHKDLPSKPKAFVELFTGTAMYRLDLLLSRMKRSIQDAGQTRRLPETAAKRLAATTKERTGKLMGEAADLVEELNYAFADAVERNYAKWIRGEADVPFVASFVPDTVVPHSHKKPKVFVLVFDGMRWDAWMEYVVPEARRRFDVSYSPTLAILPTSTGYSRRSLLSGKYPEQFKMNDAEDKLLADAWQDGPDQLTTEKDESDEIALRMHGDGAEIIIFNFSDNFIHSFPRELAYLYEEHVKKIVEKDVRRVFESIPEDAVVIVSSDHGFIELGDCYTAIPPECSFNPAKAEDIKWRYALLTQEFSIGRDAVSFRPSDIRIGDSEPYVGSGDGAIKFYKQIVLAAGSSHIRRKGKGGAVPRYSHGGISLQEMVVPCAVLTPKPLVDIASVEITAASVPEQVIAGQEAKAEVTLVLRGPAQSETVEVTSNPSILGAWSGLLLKDQPTVVALKFVTTLEENENEKAYLVKVQVKSAPGSKTKLPPPRPLKLRVVRDDSKLERTTSSELDDMFKK